MTAIVRIRLKTRSGPFFLRASASAADKVPFDMSFEDFCDNLSNEDMDAMQALLVEPEEAASAESEGSGEQKKSY